jgi:hypothetical protein
LAQAHAHGWAVYVKCVCTRGLHEYYFYAGAQAQLDKVLEPLKARHPGYRIECDERADPQWHDYCRFAEWVARGEGSAPEGASMLQPGSPPPAP